MPFQLSTDLDEDANAEQRHGTNGRDEVGGVSSVGGSVGSERRARAHPL